MAEAWNAVRVKNFIISLLRAGSRKWPPRAAVLNAAKTEKKINVKSGRLAQHYLCSTCCEEFPLTQIQVDHIESVVPLDQDSISWDEYISRLYCSENNLQVLCKTCHSDKTKEENKIRKLNRGFSKLPAYRSWIDMKSRCFNSNSPRYYTHGARGITVCDSWLSFENFYADMGDRPEGHTLDRINNDGNYEPSNCRWATPKEQANNRSTCIYVEYNGHVKTVKQWAEELGICFSAMMKRLKNWELEDAMNPQKTTAQVIPLETKEEILAFWKESGLSQSKVANLYGITQSALSKWNVEGIKCK